MRKLFPFVIGRILFFSMDASPLSFLHTCYHNHPAFGHTNPFDGLHKSANYNLTFPFSFVKDFCGERKNIPQPVKRLCGMLPLWPSSGQGMLYFVTAMAADTAAPLAASSRKGDSCRGHPNMSEKMFWRTGFLRTPFPDPSSFFTRIPVPS